MAQRRMFSMQIVDTDAFLDMPTSTQNLYFHLCMRADDDGFINNPKKIIKIVGANTDDLNVLLTKRFVLAFDNGIIVIKHWKIHNYIQKDRYKETVYIDEKRQLEIKENGSYTECIQDVSRLDTQVRLGKVSKGKVSKEIEQYIKYGDLENLPLTENQYNKLIDDYGESIIKDYINKVSYYIASKGKRYKDYNATIRSWLNKDNVHKINRNNNPIPEIDNRPIWEQ